MILSEGVNSVFVFGNQLSPVRQAHDCVSVRGEHSEFLVNPVEQFITAVPDLRVPKFEVIHPGYAPAKCLREHLMAITDAEHRRSASRRVGNVIDERLDPRVVPVDRRPRPGHDDCVELDVIGQVPVVHVVLHELSIEFPPKVASGTRAVVSGIEQCNPRPFHSSGTCPAPIIEFVTSVELSSTGWAGSVRGVSRPVATDSPTSIPLSLFGVCPASHGVHR